MFDPEAVKYNPRKTLNQLAKWSAELVPSNIRSGLIVSVKEVQCGDPNCSPVDTIFTLVFPDGKGMFGLPMAASDIDEITLKQDFPDLQTLNKWMNGEKAYWFPPISGQALKKRNSIFTWKFLIGFYDFLLFGLYDYLVSFVRKLFGIHYKNVERKM